MKFRLDSTTSFEKKKEDTAKRNCATVLSSNYCWVAFLEERMYVRILLRVYM